MSRAKYLVYLLRFSSFSKQSNRHYRTVVYNKPLVYKYSSAQKISPLFIDLCNSFLTFCKNLFFDFLLFGVFFFLLKGQKAIIITTFKNPTCKIILLPCLEFFFLIPYFMCYCQAYLKRSAFKVLWGQCFNANWTAGSSMWLLFWVWICVKCVSECLVARTSITMISICY